MRVLITNHKLGTRGGSEAFVRDLARGLQGLGHSVIAYSSDLRERERMLETDYIPVATDLENLPFMPDIIHGQHHLDAMSAVLALPGVPAIFHSHEGTWPGCPPKHPRIYHYLAMSRTLRERLMAEYNIPEPDISVFLNGVDLSRFREIRTLPARATRVLFYNSRHLANGETVSVVKEAALRCGLQLDCVGAAFGNVTEEPEKLLPGYDIVFASGISAMEALASGCAVVVLGRMTCGEMVQPESFDRLRQVNFSMAANLPPPTVAQVEQALRAYDAGRCATVSEMLRREADFKKGVGRLVALYEEVIARHRRSVPDLREEILAAARYLRTLVPLIKESRAALRKNKQAAPPVDETQVLRLLLARIEEQLRASDPA